MTPSKPLRYSSTFSVSSIWTSVHIPLHNRNGTHQPDAHVSSDLVIAATASVKFAANVLANDLRQSPLVGGVNVLIVGLDDELVSARTYGIHGTYLVLGPLGLDKLETASDLSLLLLVEDTGLQQSLREGDRSFNVGSVHPLVVFERLVELVHPENQRLQSAR